VSKHLIGYLVAFGAIHMIWLTVYSLAKKKIPAADIKRGLGVRIKSPAVTLDSEPKRFWRSIAFYFFLAVSASVLAIKLIFF
jgi:hypothetical protein